jgi:hypothetical protein
MMTLDERLHAMAALLPEGEQGRFTAPLTEGESIDSRLVETARALAKTEGLMCLTPGEFSRALVQQAARLAMPAGKAPTADTLGDDSPAALAARFAAITDPRAQTAFWRSLTAEQRAAILEAK